MVEGDSGIEAGGAPAHGPALSERNADIKRRRSIRRFEGRGLEKAVVDDILDCARFAPSAHNRQPWLIGAIDDGELLASIADLVPNGRFIQQCAVCFAVFCRSGEKYYLEDGCAATMNIILSAQGHGVGSCWVAGDKKDYGPAVRSLLRVPADYALVSLVAAGYPAQAAQPPKKPLEEIAFFNAYRGAGAEEAGLAEPPRASLAARLRRAARGFLLRRL